MKKRMVRLGLLLILTLVLVACGGGGDGGDGDEERSNAEEAAAVVTVEEVEEVAAVEGDAAHGEELYMASCVACHGPDAKGVTGLGKSLHAADSEFMRTQSDAALIEFIKVGRQPDDPLNTTGIAMPPKGGNPAMSESDMIDIVAYLRALEE